MIKISNPLVHATYPFLIYTLVSPFKFLLLDIHHTLTLLIPFWFFLTGDSSKKNPPCSHKTYHISLRLPYSNSPTHPTYVIPTLSSTPFIWIQNKFWSFGVSLPNLPLISMGSIVLLLPQSIHVQCPDAIIALLRVLMSLAPSHSTSTFLFLYPDLLRSPYTSHILVLKPIINTIPFPWLAHNSVKFPISSTIEPLSCLASKHFSLLLWVYYDNYHPLSIHQYVNQKPSFPILFKWSVYQVLHHYHTYSSHLLLCSKIN